MRTARERELNNLRNQRWRERHRERKNEQSNQYYAKKRAARLAAKALEPAPTAKRCACCKEAKPFGEFGLNRRRKDGLSSYCKECAASKRAEWNDANREKKRGSVKRYYDAHRERVLERQEIARHRRRAEQPERVLAQHREWKKRWRAANVERARERDRASRLRNRKTILACLRRWFKAHPEKKREHDMTRRARKRSAFVEVVDPTVVYERSNGLCGVCGEVIDRCSAWHVDHRVPLSKGGAHSYENTQPAHPACNMAKGAKLLPAECSVGFG